MTITQHPYFRFGQIGVALTITLALSLALSSLMLDRAIGGIYDGSFLPNLQRFLDLSRDSSFYQLHLKRLCFQVLGIAYFTGILIGARRKLKPIPSEFLNAKGMIMTVALFGLIVLVLNTIAVGLMGLSTWLAPILNILPYHGPAYWPMSIFEPRWPSPSDWIIFGAVSSAGLLIIRQEVRKESLYLWLLAVVVLVVLGSSLIQGGRTFIDPVLEPHRGSNTEGMGYYVDAIEIHDLSVFLSRFHSEEQHFKGAHTVTHPPGTTLMFYLFNKVTPNMDTIGILLATLSILLNAYFLYKLLTPYLGPGARKEFLLLFFILPSVQIYYATSIDALVSGCFLATLHYFIQNDSKRSLLASAIFLFLASSLTYAFLFMLPVLFFFEIILKRNVIRFFSLMIAFSLIHYGFYLETTFNYLTAFQIATEHQNPGGSRLWHHPLNYLFTRLECVGEVLLFFGPFLIVAFKKGWHTMWTEMRELAFCSVLAILTLLAMYVTGAFQTAETARNCIFIYPFLIIPVAGYWSNIEQDPNRKIRLLSVVFLQGTVMQLFGNYMW